MCTRDTQQNRTDTGDFFYILFIFAFPSFPFILLYSHTFIFCVYLHKIKHIKRITHLNRLTYSKCDADDQVTCIFHRFHGKTRLDSVKVCCIRAQILNEPFV